MFHGKKSVKDNDVSFVQKSRAALFLVAVSSRVTNKEESEYRRRESNEHSSSLREQTEYPLSQQADMIQVLGCSSSPTASLANEIDSRHVTGVNTIFSNMV